jgi:hypothetical protein
MARCETAVTMCGLACCAHASERGCIVMIGGQYCKLLSAIPWDCATFPAATKKSNPFKKCETMKHRTLLAIAVSAIALLAGSAMTFADDRPSNGPNYVTGSGTPKARYVRKRRPMEVEIYSNRRRRGYYSYSAADVVSTTRRTPAPYLDVRQSPGGPFDSGFYFDSGLSGHYGAQSPYMH